MKQNHDILQNKLFTGTTNLPESSLKYVNNYYINQTGQIEKVVDFSNVRGFLSNENNQKVVKAYYSFLSSSPIMNSAILANPLTTVFTPTAQFKAIYYDDEKLADSFNSFYNTSILGGISSDYITNPNVFNTSIKNQLLDGEDYEFVKQKVFHNYYFWQSRVPVSPAYSPMKLPFSNATLDIYNGDRDVSEEEKSVTVPMKGDYYFINVFLERNFTQTARIAFDICDDIIFKKINNTSTFSQNPVDKIKHEDFFKTTIKNIDGSEISQVGADVFNTATTFNNWYDYEYNELEPITTTPLIQCFVDPNFKTDENEFWSDSPKVLKSDPTGAIRKVQLNLFEKTSSSAIRASNLLDTSFVLPVINKILSNDKSVKLGGSYALSKQGTVYRSALVDLDFTAQNNNEVAPMILDNKIIRNFNTDYTPAQLIIFIESIKSAGYDIRKIIRIYNGESYMFIVHTNTIHIDLFLRTAKLPVNSSNPELLHYSYILDKKALLGRSKDFEDIQNFKIFYEPIPIDKNSFIKNKY